DQVFRLPPRIIAFPLRAQNFAEAWSKFLPFNRFLVNTLLIAVLSTIGNLLSSSLVSFSFARLSWPGRDFFFIVILASLMLPYQVTLIPVFILFKTIGWVNTYLPIIIPTFFGNAFFIFFMRQFITSIPFELDSAARIDGASTFTIFLRILMPLCTAPLATVAIFSFIWNWDELVRPLIYLNQEKLYTITLGMTMFKNQSIVYWNYLMALAILAMIPPLVIFALAQKWFTQGITITGLKG
ncbi:MAG TPA: carbohydrate ABC transporter permease, partial [Spirochaetia bacterium]|nr:carbohydrate ABC transporter permease [Spirochaetia bacterium]